MFAEMKVAEMFAPNSTDTESEGLSERQSKGVLSPVSRESEDVVVAGVDYRSVIVDDQINRGKNSGGGETSV